MSFIARIPPLYWSTYTAILQDVYLKQIFIRLSVIFLAQTFLMTKKKKQVDLGRRRFLNITGSIMALIGAVFVAIPFLKYFNPSRRAQAVGAPVKVNIADLKPGEMKIVLWRGKPVWLMRRDQQQIATLDLTNAYVADPDSRACIQPDYITTNYRSIRPDMLVLIGVCTHLGCSPQFKAVDDTSLGQNWEGGFFCPCHGSRFDIAGRVFKNQPAPTNLSIPPYYFVDADTVVVGENQPKSA